MRDPTTTTDLVVKKFTNIAFQYLCEREWRELNDSIDALFAWHRTAAEEPLMELQRIRALHLRPPAHKRGRPLQQRDRHLRIAGAVAMLVEDAGLKATRSHLARRQNDASACAIVAAALDQMGERLAERTVEGIWNRYRRSPQIIHLTVRDWIRIRYPRSNGWAGIWTSEPSKASGIGTADRR